MSILAALVLAQSTVDWRKDYSEGFTEARTSGRLLLVQFLLQGRPACAAMEEETLRHEGVVREVRKNFVAVKVDVDRSPDLFQETIGGRGGLATALVDGTGDVVSALPGFAGPDAFLAFLQRAEKGRKQLENARLSAARIPVSIDSLHELAETYQSLGSARRAEECFERVIAEAVAKGAAGKAVAFAHERLARIRVVRGKNREAREHLAKYLALDPDNGFGRLDRILFSEALVLAVERRLKESIRRTEEILARFPAAEETDQILLLQGWVRHEDGDDPGGIATLEGMLRRFPNSTWAPLAAERIAHIKNPPPDHTH